MALLRTGIALGIAIFLILDMAIVHQLLRLHGVLFSDYFEYAVLAVAAAFATRSVLARKWSMKNRLIKAGILIGFGGPLFLDVLLVDQILELHTVNYPQSINTASGMVGAILVVLGLCEWRIAGNILPRKSRVQQA